MSVTFTATVTGPSGNTTVPTGTVSFLDGTTILGSGTLNGTGVATFSTAALSAGSHSITAVYRGDSNFNGSTSTVLTQVVNAVAKLSSTTTVSSSANPSGQGQTVTLTATVTGPAGNATVPTGTVTFMDGSTTLGTGSLNGNAQATYTTSSLSNGTHSITAVYGGDANFDGSASAVLTQTVNTPNFTMGVNPATVTVKQGQTGMATVTVTPQNGFNQQVSFGCSGLPAASTCSFTPATVAPSGGNTATTTLTVQTGVMTAGMQRPAPHLSSYAVALCGFVFGIALAGRRRRWARGFWVLALVVLAGTVLGCGGGSNTPKTPAGSSQVTVTATAGQLSKTATFTLQVQ